MSGRVLAAKVMRPLNKLQKFQILSPNEMQELLKKLFREEITTVNGVIFELYSYDIPEGKEKVFGMTMQELDLLKEEEAEKWNRN